MRESAGVGRRTIFSRVVTECATVAIDADEVTRRIGHHRTGEGGRPGTASDPDLIWIVRSERSVVPSVLPVDSVDVPATSPAALGRILGFNPDTLDC